MRELDIIKDVKNAPARYVDTSGDTMTGSLNINSTAPNLVIKNTSNNDSIITLDRGINANWRFRNSNGTLHFETDYTSSKGSYYVGAKLQYDTGHFTVKGDLFAQDIEKTKVGRMFLDYYEETGYNYNLNNYVGIIAKALQKAMIKIEALESKLKKKKDSLFNSYIFYMYICTFI